MDIAGNFRSRGLKKIPTLSSPPLPPEMPADWAHLYASLSVSLAEMSKKAAK
jgi:hypothetical protein